MACYYPIQVYRSLSGRLPNGNWPIVFSPRLGYPELPLTIPCNKCHGCKLERSRQWAVRCVHEAQMQNEASTEKNPRGNCFITLTYNPESLPKNGSLNLRDVQLFIKRLRKKHGNNLRYFQCGEYGDKFSRPHHHICLFGYDFPDKKLWKFNQKTKIPIYRSLLLEKLWPYGWSTLGDVTFESAAYTARYVTKKIYGKKAQEHYEKINMETGEVIDLKPEYTTMSNGIGKSWFEKYHKTDVYGEDLIRIRRQLKTVITKPPRYYDALYDIENPEAFKKIKLKRRLAGGKHPDDQTEERLRVREVIQKRKSQQLIRSYENENI